MTIARQDITGLVLAGGRGSRMGGVDKGLQRFAGRPLVEHALARLAPQVGSLLVNANRNHEAYAACGHPVVADAQADYPGPLAGMLAGLTHCRTPWLVTVPCDSPHFPADLVERLARALADDASCAMAATVEGGEQRAQPVFCLLHVRLRDQLAAALAGGERKIDRWTSAQGCRVVPFDDAGAFFNANTLQDLQLPPA